ncbi:F-box domain containing protein [Tanacetum coccineum]
MYLVFSHMLKSFDMEDLETLWKLVKAKHGSTRPEEGYERVLWGDLKTKFDPHVEDQEDEEDEKEDSDVSSGFAAEQEKAIGCLEKEKSTFCLNTKDGLSPMRAGMPDGGVQAQFAERGCLGLELEMLEGTLKTIEDTMARMDKEVYAIYRHMRVLVFGFEAILVQEQLQGNCRVGYKARRICKALNVKKAMDLFLKGAARGSTLAMVDAGLVYWEIGKKDEGVRMYKRAAELGDPAGQCNLGISYLQGMLFQFKYAIGEWLFKFHFSFVKRNTSDIPLDSTQFSPALRSEAWAKNLVIVMCCFNGHEMWT